MNRTKIEWADYTVNFIKGKCPMQCAYQGRVYCYACKMYDRFKWNPTIRWDENEYRSALHKLANIQKPQTVFINSTMELMHPNIKPEWLLKIMDFVGLLYQHRFIMLTKMPHKLKNYIFPENLWVGASITFDNELDAMNDLAALYHCRPHKILSLEPLLGEPIAQEYLKPLIEWIIIGGLSPVPVHDMTWIQNLLILNEGKIPVFIKSNAHYEINIKEYPWPNG